MADVILYDYEVMASLGAKRGLMEGGCIERDTGDKFIGTRADWRLLVGITTEAV